MKILHFSPVKKQSEIVRLHLRSLIDLKTDDEISITFSFFDDNTDEKSSDYLKEFISSNKNSFLFSAKQIELDESENFEKRWEESLYSRITIIKDFVIDYFVNSDYDYLFLTDSDLIVHPDTLGCLLKQKKDFCAQIFWTKFDGSTIYSPNGWYDKHRGFDKTELLEFKKPNTYKVDYTGACTLLTRKILEDKVSFEKISNVSFLGEDKHFCIRAAVHDYNIYLNTEYPAFHLYNVNLLKQGENFIESGYDLGYLDSWLNKDWEKEIEKLEEVTKVTKADKYIRLLKNKIKKTVNLFIKS